MSSDPQRKAIEANANEAFDKLWATMLAPVRPELEEICRGFFLHGFAAGGQHGAELLSRKVQTDLNDLLGKGAVQ